LFDWGSVTQFGKTRITEAMVVGLWGFTAPCSSFLKSGPVHSYALIFTRLNLRHAVSTST
jgi:hypothetical protein